MSTLHHCALSVGSNPTDDTILVRAKILSSISWSRLHVRSTACE